MPNLTELIMNENHTELGVFRKRLTDIFSGTRVNFLIGAGFSKPYLETLGDLEDIQTHLSNIPMEKEESIVLMAYLLWIYFRNCMYAMVDLQAADLVEQRRFANIMYQLMNERSTPVLSKQTNIFTTNYDPILELVFDANRNIAYNDGFEGRIHPYFSSSNYSKLIYRQAIFSNNKVEVPVVNILKMHGSLTWRRIPVTGGIGELANFLIGCAFIIPAAIIYKKHKSSKTAVIGMAIGTLTLALVGAVLNYYLLLPVYAKVFGMPLQAFIDMGSALNPLIVDLKTFIFYAVVPFNILKGVIVSAITILVYKKISPILHK